MIQVKDLTKRYGSKTVVNNVSFTIEKGEIVGFLGPNGAGKTTTMNMITGYTSFTSGSVSVDWHDILEEPDEAKKNIGYLPEFPPLYPDMTVGEYLNFVFDLKKCKFDRDVHLAQVLAATKLADTEKRLIKNLSKGYRQRVGLAQALIGNPEILIFDEPTVGLDPREIKEIRNLIRALGESHTVILSSHILSEIQAVCGRVLVINDGYLVKDSPTDELLNISASSDRYAIRLAAPADEAAAAIRTLDGVVNVEFMGVFEKGTADIMAQTEKGADIRRALFELCAKKNWYILMVTPLGVSLEDVFISLVSGDAKAEAKRLADSRDAAKALLSDNSETENKPTSEPVKKKKYKKIIRKVVDKDGNLIRQTEELVEITDEGEEK